MTEIVYVELNYNWNYH